MESQYSNNEVLPNSLKNMFVKRTEKIVHLGRCLPHQTQGVEFDSQHPHKKAIQGHYTPIIIALGSGNKNSSAHMTASLSKSTNSRFREISFLKKYGRGQ